MSVDVIGDEILWQGYVVGLLVQTGVPATVMGDFVDRLRDGTLFEGEPPLCSECGADVGEGETVVVDSPDTYAAALDDVVANAKPYAKGGLLRLTDLAKIVAELKEEPA